MRDFGDTSNYLGWTLCFVPHAEQPTPSPTSTNHILPTASPSLRPTRECVDLDVHHDGHILVIGGGQPTEREDDDLYYFHTGCEDLGGYFTCENGRADTDTFTASIECCACGGGTHTTDECVDIGDSADCDLRPHPECEDTANGNMGGVDSNRGCAFMRESLAQQSAAYGAFDRYCDLYDTDDFTAREMCCGCGGGRTYIEPGRNCDPGNASHTANCCLCGGGVQPTASPTLSPTATPTSATPTAGPNAMPSASPSTSSPTGSPSVAPTSSAPTTAPTTSMPTASPTPCSDILGNPAFDDQRNADYCANEIDCSVSEERQDCLFTCSGCRTDRPSQAPSPPPTPLQSAAGAATTGGGDDGLSAGTVVGVVLAVLIVCGLGYVAYSRAKDRQQPQSTFLGDGFDNDERRRSTTGMTSVADYMNMMDNPSFVINEGGRPSVNEGAAALRGANSESEIEILLPENCAYVRKIVSRKKALLKELTIDPMRLAIGKMVGSGQFGQVFIGTLNPKAINVAIKMVKAGAGSSAANEELADEAAVTGTFNHPNVIKALGVYQEDRCWRLVLEFCGKGALQTLLSEFATAGTAAGKTAAAIAIEYGLPRLLRYTTELASAMEYLSDLKFVHRDLAARNALVSDEDTAKLADFGMSRQTGAGDSYVAVTQRPQPLRWMAPESIELMTFSSETDMWSYGVMAWEIFAMGAQPYKGVSNLMIYKELVVDGTRLQCPAGCPESVYAALGPTWLLAPGKRPGFAELHEQLQAIRLLLDDADAAAPPVTDAALLAVNADYRLMPIAAAEPAKEIEAGQTTDELVDQIVQTVQGAGGNVYEMSVPPMQTAQGRQTTDELVDHIVQTAQGAGGNGYEMPVPPVQTADSTEAQPLYRDVAPVPLAQAAAVPAAASLGTTPCDYVNSPPAVRGAKRENRLNLLLGGADQQPQGVGQPTATNQPTDAGPGCPPDTAAMQFDHSSEGISL